MRRGACPSFLQRFVGNPVGRQTQLEKIEKREYSRYTGRFLCSNVLRKCLGSVSNSVWRGFFFWLAFLHSSAMVPLWKSLGRTQLYWAASSKSCTVHIHLIERFARRFINSVQKNEIFLFLATEIRRLRRLKVFFAASPPKKVQLSEISGAASPPLKKFN